MILKIKGEIYKVLKQYDQKALVLNVKKKRLPEMLDVSTAEEIEFELKLTISHPKEALAHKRYTIIAPVLPYLENTKERGRIIKTSAEFYGVSRQTLINYLHTFLLYDNINALSAPTSHEKPLSEVEKTFRWALNKFYYTSHKNRLTEAYTMLLNAKYTDATGKLLENYPSFYQFRYFYRKTKSMRTYYISREGIKAYERNYRPLTGDGVQEMAVSAGFGMMDATTCDIYLINEAGGVVGRPILTACIDAYEGLCLGYSLSWEGGVYSLTDLMLNVVEDKQEHCKKYGIDSENWNSKELPATLITDMGKEYLSGSFGQITEMGVNLISLPSYRPDLKGPVEQFFNAVQDDYKPYLKGKGVIEPDFQERGAHDYRKDACLTLEDFRKVILKCIIHYNIKRIVDFPFTEQMLKDKVKPHANDIYQWSLKNNANVLKVEKDQLTLCLLPRCTGRFTRNGLVVQQMRYHCEGYDECYLKGGEVEVSYNPDDSTFVWIKDDDFVKFTLIESVYRAKSFDEVGNMMETKRGLMKAEEHTKIQGDIDLARFIENLTASTDNSVKSIKNISKNRRSEKNKTHKNLLKEAGVC